MRVIDKTAKLDRRTFIRHSAAAAALTGMVGAFADSAAFAAALKTAPAASAPTLVKVARDLYPHDRFPDAIYETAIATIDATFAADVATKTLFADGVAQLDAASLKLKGARYETIASEEDRVAVLKSIETSQFFIHTRKQMETALYNQQDVWAKLGYEGSSADKGGYIHRGFNDIDWLPA